ncbi:MAG: 5-oxoprolinase subunit PxpB [Ilumatobacteraceae bacterium]
MSGDVTILAYGPAAALLEVADTATAAALAGHLQRLRITGRIDVVDVVPAARTVLVQCSSPDALAGALRLATEFETMALPPDAANIVEIPVRYDGPDLDDVAAATGLAAAEVVRLHCAVIYVAAFSGFAPGFTYLVGLDPALHLPRLSTPRQRIPAGSVAIGGEFTGVYPTASPGGWRLLGSTDAVLWDLHRATPTLIPPGSRVRFIDRTPR